MTSSYDLSSSRRIIKRSDPVMQPLVQLYEPPRELTLSRQKPAPARKAAFTQYTKDGRVKGEYALSPEDDVSQSYPAESGEQLQEDFSGVDQELFAQMKEEAERTLEDAKREAQEIVQAAREQASQILEEARTEGYKEGYGNGYQDGEERAGEACRAEFQKTLSGFQADMRQAIRSVDIAKENCVRAYLDELKNCAIAVGEKVIHISLKSSGEVIKQMIISATEKLKKTAWVKIYIDKCDYDMMMEADTGILDELSRLSDNIKFIVMDKEERGSCIIEMPEEIVDVSVNTQIENIKDILENIRM